MASLCADAGGRLILASKTMNVAPLSLSLTYGGGQVELVQLGIAIGAQVEQEVLAQFQNALSNAIFVTPFGDAPGQVRVTFIANRVCNFEGTGFGAIEHYFDRRLSPGDQDAAAIVTIGPAAFRAYLTNLMVNASTADTPVVQATLAFRAWPLS